MNLNLYQFKIISKLNYRDLIIFLIPTIIFSIYLFIYNPGILTYDSFNQLHQVASGQFYNWHPFFHTFIEMICLKIYPNPMSVCILQIFVFSVFWMVICKYNRDDGVENNNQFILQFIITLVISLIPINAIYAITLWKDILFSYLLMFLCFLVKIMIDRAGKVNYKFIIIFSLTMAFISQLRPNGIYVIILSLVIFSIYLFRKNRVSKIYVALPALTILFILLIASLNVAYEVEDNQKDAFFVKTIHMLADYDLNLDMKDSDRDKIHEIFNEKDIKEKYNPYYSDCLPGKVNNISDDNKWEYVGIAIKYSLQNPFHFLKYMLKSSAIVWDITRDDDWVGQPYYIYEEGPKLESARSMFLKAHQVKPIEDFEKMNEVNMGTAEFDFANSIVNQIRENIILNTLFTSPALYMYLAIILMILIYFITRSRDIFLVYLPNFLNIVIVFLSTPIQDTRYLYGNLLVCYLILIIFLNIYHKSRLEKPNLN